MTNTTLFIKRSIKSVASISKARFGFPAPASGAVNIIAFHRVVRDIAKAERDAINGIVISTATFRRHCEMLNRAFDVVSLETAMHFLGEGRRAARPVAVLTFDDGYRDFYDEAFPVLNDLGLPATVFLPTGYIGKQIPLAHDRIFWLVKTAREKSISIIPALQRAGLDGGFPVSAQLLKITEHLVYLPNDQRESVIDEIRRELNNKFEDYPLENQLLNWDKIREMGRKGINFGSHTVNHVVLPLENESIMRTEIEASKTELEQNLDKKVTSFAYPNGEYDTTVKMMTAEAGYKVAVTTEKKINNTGSDLFALGRTSLCEESTRGIKGTYSAQVANLRLGV